MQHIHLLSNKFTTSVGRSVTPAFQSGNGVRSFGCDSTLATDSVITKLFQWHKKTDNYYYHVVSNHNSQHFPTNSGQKKTSPSHTLERICSLKAAGAVLGTIFFSFGTGGFFDLGFDQQRSHGRFIYIAIASFLSWLLMIFLMYHVILLESNYSSYRYHPISIDPLLWWSNQCTFWGVSLFGCCDTVAILQQVDVCDKHTYIYLPMQASAISIHLRSSLLCTYPINDATMTRLWCIVMYI